MYAVVLNQYGGIDQLEWKEVPSPRPGAGEVLVKLAATSVNPIDWKLRKGEAKARIPLELPAILGRDLSGEVIALGAGVTQVRIGDHVLGLTMRTYAEEVVAKADILAPLPHNLAATDGAALPLVITTGAQLISDAVRLERGQSILVTGAAGGVGRVAVFVAKQRGGRVIAGVRASQRDEAGELGADQVVALDDAAAIDRLPPLDAIADTVGGDVLAKLLPRLRDGGTLGSVVGEPAAAKGRPITVRAFMTHPDGRVLAELAEAVARGELTIPIAKRLPLQQAAAAQELAEHGRLQGKVVLLA